LPPINHQPGNGLSRNHLKKDFLGDYGPPSNTY
jgi:hypothetical protein